MKSKIISVLLAGLFISGFNLPANAAEINYSSDLNTFVNRINNEHTKFNQADISCNTSDIYSSEEESKALLNNILQYIKQNYSEQDYNNIMTEENNAEQNQKYVTNSIEQSYREAGGGSGCGRDMSRSQTKFYLARCEQLINKIKDDKNVIIVTPPEICNNNENGWHYNNGKYFYILNGQLALNQLIKTKDSYGYTVGADGTLNQKNYYTYVYKYNGLTNDATIFVDNQYITFNAPDLTIGDGCRVDVDLTGKVIAYTKDDLYRNNHYSFENYANAHKTDEYGWTEENGKWRFYDKNGSYLTNTTVDGYVLGNDGYWVK